MLVDFEELQVMSGLRRQTGVIEWLKLNGIPHVVGADGKPRTTDDILSRSIAGELKPVKGDTPE